MKNILLVLLLLVYEINSEDSSVAKIRRKRYIVFPEGSSLTVAFCLTIAIYTGFQDNEIFSEAMNWGIVYDLPDKTEEVLEKLRLSKAVSQRRDRRDLYHKMEVIMNSMGWNGTDCIYRTLCEANQFVFPKGQNMFEELLRIIFKFPLERLSDSEPEEHRLYHRAQRIGMDRENCEELFSNCPYSLLKMALIEGARSI